jgi:hypothetical protein
MRRRRLGTSEDASRAGLAKREVKEAAKSRGDDARQPVVLPVTADRAGHVTEVDVPAANERLRGLVHVHILLTRRAPRQRVFL